MFNPFRKRHQSRPERLYDPYDSYDYGTEESPAETATEAYSSTIHEVYADMIAQPHLLIAGATGSGKSVVINGCIYTALFDHTNQFIFIDPKRVELCGYRSLPQCLRYASEPAEMLQALEYALDIIEKRFQTMQAEGKRKYTGGHVYVVIDELADLMTTQRRAVQPLLQRIAQIGRAACVHLIAATQCPLATVIPTQIKCNFDARVALRARSAQDSRNIIERAGCEKLPRYGQAIYMTPDADRKIGVPMIQDADLEEITLFHVNYRQWIREYR